MYESIPRLEDYDVSPINGFLSTNPPCTHLSEPYYAPWESVIGNLHALVLTKRLRTVVDRLEILHTDLLRDEDEWRRAYSILGFIVHAYVWGGETPADVIPPPISIPFLECCDRLELPPVATYAGLCLWNWRPLIPSEPVDSLDNIFTLHTMTGSMDESWFYLVSIAIEARGAPLVPLMLQAVAAARAGDQDTVTEALRSFAERVDELGMLLERMYENCDPHVFYHRIRPLLAGSKNMAEAGLPQGVLFDTGSPNDEYVQFSGGSNAQSSIIQFFDIILGVEHHPTGSRSDSPGTQGAAGGPPTGAPGPNFIHTMRQYMPGPHRRFLQHVERVANIRPFVVQHAASNAALRTAYDACLAMLRAFRDVHIRIVSRYIIIKSREASERSNSTSPPRPNVPKRMNLAVASSNPAPVAVYEDGVAREPRSINRKLKGTGGTALIPFLKQARDETGEPAIDAWARRLLNNGPGNISTSLRTGRNSFDFGFGVPKGVVGAKMGKVGEHASGDREIVGLAGVWTVDDSEGGICHW